MPIDMSAAIKAPPARRNARNSTSQTAARIQVQTQTIREQRETGLSGVGQLGQGLCLMSKQYAQAATFGMYWAPIARELAVLAESQSVVAKAADFLITAGPYAALIQVGLPFIMQTAANYGLIDAEKAVGANIVPPKVLEAQMKADMSRIQAEALRDQQMAMQEAAKAQREYQAMVIAQEKVARAEAEGMNNHDAAAVS